MASGYIEKANEKKEEADSNRLIGSSILPIEEVSIELVDNTYTRRKELWWRR